MKRRKTATGSHADRQTRQNNRLARVLRILLLIQGRGRWSIGDLSRELECSQRTIYRDLDVLTLAGVPWESDEHGAIRVSPGFRAVDVDLGRDDLIDQATASLVGTARGTGLGDRSRRVAERLATAQGDDAVALLQEVTKVTAVLDLKVAGDARHAQLLTTAQKALLSRQQLVGVYRAANDAKPRRLTLHPYRLFLARQAWYLVARPARTDNPKTYRMARFQSLHCISRDAPCPDDFDLRSYLGNAWSVFRGQRTYDVELLFDAAIAPVVLETTWHRTQRVRRHPDGTVTLFFQIDGLEEILWWVIGWTSACRVIKPPELRDRIVAELRAALDVHDVTKSGRNTGGSAP